MTSVFPLTHLLAQNILLKMSGFMHVAYDFKCAVHNLCSWNILQVYFLYHDNAKLIVYISWYILFGCSQNVSCITSDICIPQIYRHHYYSDVTWPSWRLKSLTILFFQKLVQAKQQKNFKIVITGLLWGKPPVTDGLHPHRASNTEGVYTMKSSWIRNSYHNQRMSFLSPAKSIKYTSSFRVQNIVVLPAKHVHSISKEFFDVLFCIYFTGTGEITRLSLCQLRGQEKYG